MTKGHGPLRYEINYDHPEGAAIEWRADNTRVHRYGNGPWLNDHGEPVEHTSPTRRPTNMTRSPTD